MIERQFGPVGGWTGWLASLLIALPSLWFFWQPIWFLRTYPDARFEWDFWGYYPLIGLGFLAAAYAMRNAPWLKSKIIVRPRGLVVEASGPGNEVPARALGWDEIAGFGFRAPLMVKEHHFPFIIRLRSAGSAVPEEIVLYMGGFDCSATDILQGIAAAARVAGWRIEGPPLDAPKRGTLDWRLVRAGNGAPD